MTGLIVDSFAGGGGASLGIEMALGRSPDIAINHDAEAVAMHAANHPATEHYCRSVWQIDPMDAVHGRQVDLLWASPDCFPAGTMVLTREGYRPIEQILVGDEVLTHKQRWRRVVEISRATKPLIKLRGHGHPGLAVSAEYPFLARKRTNVWDNEVRQYRPNYGPADWVQAKVLDSGWYWSSPTQFPAAVPPAVPIYGKRETRIDETLIWLAGRYLADGWTRLDSDRAELVITCGMHKVDALRAVLSTWARRGARCTANEMAWHERATATAYQFASDHRGLVEWLREHFGHGAAGKLIPGWALGMEESLRTALLDGYMSGDGRRGDIAGRPCCDCSTVSKALCFGLKALAASLGKTVAVYKNRNSSVIQGRQVNAKDAWHLRWRERIVDGHGQTFRADGLEWAPIRERTDFAESGEVFNIGVEEDESYVVDGIVVHNCKHFSKAKGGRPVRREIRDLAWVVVLWARRARPAVICLENVEEFRDWGPLDLDGRPCPERRGKTFDRWVGELRRLGYSVQWRQLRACDYGAPTIRRRLFLIARRDGRKIVWPSPTHGDPASPEVRAGRLKPWRVAADCLDWSLPCPSIFLTKEEARAIGVNRPLAEATMARIARGVRRYVLEAAEPFIVPITHTGDVRVHGIDKPLRTITTAHRGELALAAPFVTKFRQNGSGVTVNEPLHTAVAGATAMGLVSAFVSRQFGASIGADAEAPLPTTTAGGGGKSALVAAFLAQHNGGMTGHDAREPVSTLTTKGCHQQLVTSSLLKLRGTCRDGQAVEQPLPTVTAGGSHLGEVRAFLLKYYGEGSQDQDCRDPLHTIPTRDRFGLVTIAGEPWQIVDIGMRMLTPRELFRAQGFPDSYVIDPIVAGRPLTKTAQIRMCGNSVCPQVAAAIVAANVTSIQERSAA